MVTLIPYIDHTIATGGQLIGQYRSRKTSTNDQKFFLHAVNVKQLVAA
jgi:hypothetical protein